MLSTPARSISAHRWEGRRSAPCIAQRHERLPAEFGHVYTGTPDVGWRCGRLNGNRPLGHVVSYQFLKTGRYLVICMNRSHFLNDWMFGFVNVVADE